MPAHEPTILPDGWQVVQRSDGWWLQRRIVGSELWLDAHGPVKQRIQAVRAYRRRVLREQPEIAARLTPPTQEQEERDDGSNNTR